MTTPPVDEDEMILKKLVIVSHFSVHICSVDTGVVQAILHSFRYA